jgi:hypothetical protein
MIAGGVTTRPCNIAHHKQSGGNTNGKKSIQKSRHHQERNESQKSQGRQAAGQDQEAQESTQKGLIFTISGLF